MVTAVGFTVLSLIGACGGSLITSQPTPVRQSLPAVQETRNKYTWPFASTSIWNMPIGTGATYVSADIHLPTLQTLTTDQDIIIMSLKSHLTKLTYNGSGWDGSSRCAAGSTFTKVPIPRSFVVNSTTGNDALAVVMPDGQTVVQGQPFDRCTAGGPATIKYQVASTNLYGAGTYGAHGGSGLSSLGGTIRLNELVPGGSIRHALKVNLDGYTDLYPSPGYVWPAVRDDACAPGCYGGTNPALEMGSLLAIPTSINLSSLGLETQPGMEIAWTLQNYGAYVADNTARSVFSVETEDSPAGTVVSQFQSTWGYPLQAPAGDGTPWSRDINTILANLSVVTNNTATTVGGGGTPLQPLAPPIGN